MFPPSQLTIVFFPRVYYTVRTTTKTHTHTFRATNAPARRNAWQNSVQNFLPQLSFLNFPVFGVRNRAPTVRCTQLARRLQPSLFVEQTSVEISPDKGCVTILTPGGGIRQLRQWRSCGGASSHEVTLPCSKKCRTELQLSYNK